MTTAATTRAVAKPIGSRKARAQVAKMTNRLKKHNRADKLTPTEAARVLFLTVDDVRNVRNVRAGNKISVPMIIRMMIAGIDPKSVFEGPTLTMLPKGARFRGAKKVEAQQKLLGDRIRKLAWTRPGKEWAKLTGLSDTGAYGLRYALDAKHTLYTVIGFINAGHTVDELFGIKR